MWTKGTDNSTSQPTPNKMSDEHYEGEHHHHPNESASNTSDYHENSYYYYYYDDYDYDHFSGVPFQTYRWILAVGVVPVCLLGLAANAVSVRVWNANRKRNTMVLLFQGLGVADNFFLLTTALRVLLMWLHVLTAQVEAYIFPLLYLSQCLSIHVTLVIGVFRWLAVARPQRSLKRRHVLATCGGIGAWCVLLTAVVVIRENVVKSHGTRHTTIMVVVSQVTGFVLPTLLLLVFSLALLRITWRHKRLQSQKKHLKTTTAVLSIACSSFLACPVAVAVHLLAVFTTHNDAHDAHAPCSSTCVYVAVGVGDFLQVLNSSVNFLFYFFFASKFRPLLQRALCTCTCCPEGYWRRYSQRKASTTSSIQVTSDSGSGTTSSTTHNGCGLGIYRQDSGAEAAVPFREPSTSTATTTTTTTEASAAAAERELSAGGGGEACREEESSATEATSFV